MVPYLTGFVGAIEQEGSARLGDAEDVEPLQEGKLVTGDETGPVDQVGGADRLGSEAKVRDRRRTGFLGVVNKVALSVIVRFLADDLDAVFIGANGAVRAEAIEDGPDCGRIFCGEARIVLETGVGHIINNADGKMV